MIYESTFSDILGIMFFYFIIQSTDSNGIGEMGLNLLLNVLGTITVSFAISYILILIFQNIRTQVKLFLLISVLVLLYSLAKLMHMSSLLIILVFGLVLQNRHIFFAGAMKNLLKEEPLKEISNNFRSKDIFLCNIRDHDYPVFTL
jgi:NhaP-type Na+/H+ or K+/H+ antiporter